MNSSIISLLRVVERLNKCFDPIPDFGSDAENRSPFVELSKTTFQVDNILRFLRGRNGTEQRHSTTFPIGQTFGFRNMKCKLLYFFMKGEQDEIDHGLFGPGLFQPRAMNQHIQQALQRQIRQQVGNLTHQQYEQWKVCVILELQGLETPTSLKGELVIGVTLLGVVVGWERQIIPIQTGSYRIVVMFALDSRYHTIHSSTLSVDIQFKLTKATAGESHHQRIQEASSIIADLNVSLNSDLGTDVVLTVPTSGENGKQFYTRKVHKPILMARSTVFAAMFDPENGMLEGQNGEVLIKELSPKGLDILVHFIYSGEIADNWAGVPGEVLDMSEKYNFPLLKDFCDKNLLLVCMAENVMELFKLAKLHGLKHAKTGLAEFISKNTRLVLENSIL